MKEKKTMIWYPYEQLKTMKAPYEIVDANGVYLYTKDQKMIDSAPRSCVMRMTEVPMSC